LSTLPPKSAGRYTGPAVFLLAAFVAGLILLLMLRFERGDVYPPYSSLRSDPLGTRALFEGLNSLKSNKAPDDHADKHPDMAQRWYRSPDRVNMDTRTTLLFCGMAPNMLQMQGRTWEQLIEHLSADGGRIIIAFGDPAQEKEASEKKDQDEPLDKEKQSTDEDDTAPESEAPDQPQAKAKKKPIWKARKKLGIHVALGRRKGPVHEALLAPASQNMGLPVVAPWHGTQFFEMDDDQWESLYYIDQEEQPVIVKRAWGHGELVLVADNYLFSNEALSKERSTTLLTWFLAPDHRIVFDEFHNGIVQQPGIATLARKYGLEGIFAVMVLICLLFIWRHSLTFVPPVIEPYPNGDMPIISGSDSGRGMISLMQRHLPARQLIAICFDAWLSGPAAQQVSAERIARARQWIESQDAARHDPVGAYRHIVQLLEQRNYL
jgi:hypothetical protein